MTRYTLRLTVGTMICTALLGSGTPSAGPGGNLKLAVQMSRSNYVIGEPILSLVQVRNGGPGIFEDLTLLRPYAGFLQMELQRDGEVVPRFGRHDDVTFLSEGISLVPGGATCEIVDLVQYYGTVDTMRLAGGATFVRPLLPQGRYVVSFKLLARTGMARTLPQVELKSRPLRFTVRDGLGLGQQEVEVNQAIDQLDRVGARNTASVASRRLQAMSSIRSRYFLQLLLCLRISEEALTCQDLLETLTRAGREPVLSAAVLDQRLTGLELRDKEKLAFVEALKGGVFDHPAVSAVITSWLIKLRQGKFYPSFEPQYGRPAH